MGDDRTHGPTTRTSAGTQALAEVFNGSLKLSQHVLSSARRRSRLTSNWLPRQDCDVTRAGDDAASDDNAAHEAG
jgi:hypothetical protein